MAVTTVFPLATQDGTTSGIWRSSYAQSLSLGVVQTTLCSRNPTTSKFLIKTRYLNFKQNIVHKYDENLKLVLFHLLLFLNFIQVYYCFSFFAYTKTLYLHLTTFFLLPLNFRLGFKRTTVGKTAAGVESAAIKN